MAGNNLVRKLNHVGKAFSHQPSLAFAKIFKLTVTLLFPIVSFCFSFLPFFFFYKLIYCSTLMLIVRSTELMPHDHWCDPIQNDDTCHLGPGRFLNIYIISILLINSSVCVLTVLQDYYPRQTVLQICDHGIGLHARGCWLFWALQPLFDIIIQMLRTAVSLHWLSRLNKVRYIFSIPLNEMIGT